jgi:hypothetical protein
MTLEMMKELFGVMHVGEEEVPNVKHMRIREEEVSSSLPVTVMVPPEEEEVPVSQGPANVVPPREEVPPEEEEVPAPLSRSRCRALLSRSHRRKKSCRAPLSRSHQRKRRSQPPCHGPAGRKGMPCLGTALGKFFALLFFSKMQEILLALFSLKRSRFVG